MRETFRSKLKFQMYPGGRHFKSRQHHERFVKRNSDRSWRRERRLSAAKGTDASQRVELTVQHMRACSAPAAAAAAP